MSAQLMSFGFYATLPKIVDLCKPLVAVLDGRSDQKISEEEDARSKAISSSPSDFNDDELERRSSFTGYETNPIFKQEGGDDNKRRLSLQTGWKAVSKVDEYEGECMELS